jgi:hypothetical protein
VVGFHHPWVLIAWPNLPTDLCARALNHRTPINPDPKALTLFATVLGTLWLLQGPAGGSPTLDRRLGRSNATVVRLDGGLRRRDARPNYFTTTGNHCGLS